MGAVTSPEYIPGPVERFGRHLKLEYVGMASVFVAIFNLGFGGRAARGLRPVGHAGNGAR